METANVTIRPINYASYDEEQKVRNMVLRWNPNAWFFSEDIVLVAIDGITESGEDNIVGTIATRRYGFAFTEFRHLYVDSNNRRRGIATALYRTAMERATTPVIGGTVNVTNIPMKGFVDKMVEGDDTVSTNIGFERVDRQLAYYLIKNPRNLNQDEPLPETESNFTGGNDDNFVN
jgi:ribosomal protein S18 acetylase RimI-like enzyme